MEKIDYIEFKSVDNGIECTWRYDDKLLVISDEYVKKVYRYLNEYDFEYKIGISDGQVARRYYGVTKEIVNLLNENKKNTKKKVNRVNKYANMMALIAGITATAIIIGQAAAYAIDKLFKGKNEDEEPTTTISMEISSDKTLEVPTEATTEYSSEYGKISIDDIIITDSNFNFEFEDRSQSDKADKTRELYYDVIDQYSNMYGLPTNLMVAVATQECGVHQTTRSSGGGFGLFQIQVGDKGFSWLGNNVTAYNFETGKEETLTVGKTAAGELSMDMLANLEYNVKVGCMIMAAELERCDYDIICALQSYNSGNVARKLKDKYGEDWVNHRDGIIGDDLYIEHVLSYIREDDNVLQYIDRNNKPYAISINNVYSKSKALT